MRNIVLEHDFFSEFAEKFADFCEKEIEAEVSALRSMGNDGTRIVSVYVCPGVSDDYAIAEFTKCLRGEFN